MKKMKMSLQSIQGVLSREEMRQIMAGSEGDVCGNCFVSDPSGSYPAAFTRNIVDGCWCPNGMPC